MTVTPNAHHLGIPGADASLCMRDVFIDRTLDGVADFVNLL